LGIRRALGLAFAVALSTLLLAPRAGGQLAPGTAAFAARAVPESAMPGGSVDVLVTGMAPGSSVAVSIASQPGPPLGVGLGAPDGSARVKAPVPTAQPLGDMELVVAGTDAAGAAQTVSVHVSIVSADMAVTGASETVVLTMVGVGLLGAGFVLRHAAGRRLAALRARLAPVRVRLRLRRDEPARRVRLRPRWGDPAAAVPMPEARRRVRLRCRV